jgi:hypothetical protein
MFHVYSQISFIFGRCQNIKPEHSEAQIDVGRQLQLWMFENSCIMVRGQASVTAFLAIVSRTIESLCPQRVSNPRLTCSQYTRKVYVIR